MDVNHRSNIMTIFQEMQSPEINDCCPLCQTSMTFSMMGSQPVVYCSDSDCSEHTIIEIPNSYIDTTEAHNAVGWKKSYRRI